jgi:purine catabolism regulator
VVSGDVRVEDLLRSPALQLRLLAGSTGVDRAVSWAHVSELEDPTPWLLGAEMIMTTGIAIPRSASGQRAYIERLDDAGVSALALSEGLHVPPLRRAFLAAADERRFPVLEVPLPVPFVSVTQEVAAAQGGDVGARLGAQLRVFGALRWMTTEALDPGAIFARLADLSGYALFACTPSGRPLVDGLPAPPPGAIAALPASPSAPPSVPGGFVLPIPSPGGPAGHLVAIERDGVRPAGLAVVQHIATVAALHLTMGRQVAETGRREAAETLAELLRGVLTGREVVSRLSRRGFEPDATVVLASIGRRTGGRVADEVLDRVLDDLGAPTLVLGQADVHFVLTVASAPLAPLLRVLEGAVAGVSAPLAVGEVLEPARREALWALERARNTGVAVVAYGEIGAVERWLPSDPETLRSLVAAVLGPVLHHDARRRGSVLAETVTVWLDHDRSSAATARALGIHPNSLAYRLRRFSELTGRDLGVSGDLAEVWLAFGALRALRQM